MTCKDIIEIQEFREALKLKAGEGGLANQVRWIYFADCLQCVKREYRMEDYIHGGEFVVLTNERVTADSQVLMPLVRQMWEYGISALGINEGQIPEELLKYCQEKDLPLFELPESFPLIDLSQIMCRRLVLEENDRNGAEQLFSSILDAEHTSRNRVMAQARRLKINLEGSFCVAEFAFEYSKDGLEKDDFQALEQSVSRIINVEFSFSMGEDLLILPQAGSFLVLIPVSRFSDQLIREILHRVIDRVERELDTNLKVGVGNPALYLDEVKRSRNEAAAAIRAAVASHMTGRVFFYKDQGVYTLISHVDDDRILDAYVKAKLGKLLRYDELNGGNLCETLENYLSHGCNSKRTAQDMFIHRNTLNYRMKKIGEILDLDFENLDQCLDLKLAFSIMKYRDR